VVVRCETGAKTAVMISVKAEGEHAKPVMSERQKVIDWKGAYDILQCEVKSLEICLEIPPFKPKGEEVYLFCSTDDNKRSK